MLCWKHQTDQTVCRVESVSSLSALQTSEDLWPLETPSYNNLHWLGAMLLSDSGSGLQDETVAAAVDAVEVTVQN